MISVAFRRLAGAAVALALLAAPSWAQSNGQPYQPQGGLSLVGTWSGYSVGSQGTIPQSEAFSENGQFVTVSRQSNGFIGRYWGNYRTTPIGPNQLRLETQLQGYLPRETCSQVPGNPPNCHPMPLQPYSVTTVTFSSPYQMSTDNGVTEQRDNQPALLQAQAPERWVTMLQSPRRRRPSRHPTPATLPGARYPVMHVPTMISREACAGIPAGSSLREAACNV